MGDAWLSINKLTYTEYEALESTTEHTRYEFYNGEVWAMSGGTLAHNQLVQNIGYSLRQRFRPQGCRIYTESVKLEVSFQQYYFYPDVILTCSSQDASQTKKVNEPVLLAEILSESTESKDLGKKADIYQKIPSLKTYLIVSQKECWVRIYERKGDFWTHRYMNQLSDTLYIPDLDWSIPLEELYQDVAIV